MTTDVETVVPNHYLDPWFNSEEKKLLQRLGLGAVDAAVAEVQPALDTLTQQIADLTVDPVPFRFVASGGQTEFTVNGAAADSGELVLVFRNGLHLSPATQYSVTSDTDPETTTITLVTPSTGGDIITGVIYNITVAVAGGGGGVNNLDELGDVLITSPVNAQVLKYNSSLGKWVNDTDQTGGGAGATNLSFSRDATTVTVESDTGTDAVLPFATGTLAGVMPAADKAKLDAIEANATQNATDADLRDRSTHTGTQAFSTITMATARLLGRSTAGSGAAEEVSIGPGLSLAAGVLSTSGSSGATPDYIIQSYGVI